MPGPRNGTKPQQLILKVFTFATLLAVTTCSCEVDELEESHWQYPDSLVGVWVRVYPSPAGVDTVWLEPNGVARGPRSAVSATEIERITQWRMDWIDPRNVCFRDGRVGECSGYLLRGDTLALAIPAQTVLVRAEVLSCDAAATDSSKEGDRSRWGDSVPITKPPGRQ